MIGIKRFFATGLWALSLPFTGIGLALVLTANNLVGGKWSDEEEDAYDED